MFHYEWTFFKLVPQISKLFMKNTSFPKNCKRTLLLAGKRRYQQNSLKNSSWYITRYTCTSTRCISYILPNKLIKCLPIWSLLCLTGSLICINWRCQGRAYLIDSHRRSKRVKFRKLEPGLSARTRRRLQFRLKVKEASVGKMMACSKVSTRIRGV